MADAAQKQTLGFQTEVKQLLHLMIHALYSNKEIFLRELISNASDAADKLRFATLANPELYENDSDLKVKVSFNKKQRTVTISDNGIGMSREEVIQHLGTIAKSGTREFLAQLTGEQAKDAHLIGQFGVGFYSAFIVADQVVVETRKSGLTAEQGVRWESKGEGEYSIENIDKPERGTTITLHLKKGEDEFLDDWRIRQVIKKYSDHITLPVVMPKAASAAEESKEADADQGADEVVNKATALWTLPKTEIKDSDYNEFYKHIAHDFEDPLIWSHNRVEGKQEYISLLYIPARAPFDLYHQDQQHGLKLYVRRVYILDDAKQFLPNYLRFVRGVIDSNDLPLNISREILQSNKLVDSMRTALTKRVLSMLEKLANDKELYAKFWAQFGPVLKEGPAEDFANREAIAKLLRFTTTASNGKPEVALSDYISRMQAGQEKIYYITAETQAAAENSPHLEIFRKKGVEVLLLTDRIDEWLVAHLTEFEGKSLQSVAKGDLDLGKLSDEADSTKQKQQEGELTSLIKQAKEVLGEQVKDVRLTHRLVDSPACIVADEHDLGSHMQRILQAAGQSMPASKPILELNPEHPIIEKIKQETDEQRFAEWVQILFEQSVLAEGGQLSNPAGFVQRVNKFLIEMAA